MSWQEEYRKKIRLSVNWQEEYQRKTISADQAAQKFRSGDSVVCPIGREPLAVGLALAARKDELKGLRLFMATPTFDFGWYDPGWEDSFAISTTYVFPRGVASRCLAEKRCDNVLGGLFLTVEASDIWNADVLFIEVSPPDKDGYCSFGASVYDKRRWVAQSKLIIAEVNDCLIRTYGDNFVHVSQLDYFVKHIHDSRRKPGEASQFGQQLGEISAELRQISEYVRSLIKNGDTLQIGTGTTSEGLIRAGLLEGHEAIGWHSEVTPGGIIRLVKEGCITGERKAIDRGKAVAAAIGGGTIEEMDFVHMNPIFELRDLEYTHDPRTIASLDNMVTVNNALAVDLTGQVAAESVGPRIFSGAGGLLCFSIGASLSKGGRSIIVLPSTAQRGAISRIVPMLALGTKVTVPHTLADMIVTEYGVAHLKGKSQRQRAEEMIAIAHPDLRGELKKAAHELYWP